MYKVVNIADLNVATEFAERDKVIEIDATRTKMKVATNDYAHKCKSYLSDAVDTVDGSFNSYITAIDKINTTYFTTDVSDVYLKNGSLINQETLDKIITSGAFLTKEACKSFETKCKAYIDELKNKAVSNIMAQLNQSFIKQNSAGKVTYGQSSTTNSSQSVSYTAKIVVDEDTNTTSYNFENGEFSLPQLLFGFGGKGITDPFDFWKTFYKGAPQRTFLLDDAKTALEDTYKTTLIFNCDSKNLDFKIHVPKGSFDYENFNSIPVAELIEIVIKRQIKAVIKNICDLYISKMTSVPTITTNS